MNICKYLRRPESVKSTHHCVCTSVFNSLTLHGHLRSQQYWISARDLHDSLRLFGSKISIMTKKKVFGLNRLQFTLNPKRVCVPSATEPNSWLAPTDDCFYLMVKFWSFFVSLYRPCFNINFSVFSEWVLLWTCMACDPNLCRFRETRPVNDPPIPTLITDSLSVKSFCQFFFLTVRIQWYSGTWRPPLVSQICSVIISALVCSSYSVSHHRSLRGTRQATLKGSKVQLDELSLAEPTIPAVFIFFCHIICL